jgi:hypothetical protein
VKRRSIGSHEKKTKQEPLIISARINNGKPEPIRVLHFTKEPKLGQIFRGVPTRFQTNLFQKALYVVSLSQEKGITVFHCTTDIAGTH